MKLLPPSVLVAPHAWSCCPEAVGETTSRRLERADSSIVADSSGKGAEGTKAPVAAPLAGSITGIGPCVVGSASAAAIGGDSLLVSSSRKLAEYTGGEASAVKE